VASKNPSSFRREDTADRLVILRLERRNDFGRPEALEAAIAALRPQLLGEYLYYVNRIVAEIRSGVLDEQQDEGFRMADFAGLARVVGRVLEWSEGDVTDLLIAIQGEQIAFINEEDPLTDLLHKWVIYKTAGKPSNIGRLINLFTLFQEMESLAQANGIAFYKTARVLSQKLRSPHIERDFIIQMIAPDGRKSYRIWRKTDPQLQSIPLATEPTGEEED